ncbi:MAG: hypothetical protein CM15mP103_04720 [Gammaproteobacteria bacterium]|nr:MAG: hypothetical protein CM15mP103_04720 [Gammaproteobacteria bacterium]
MRNRTVMLGLGYAGLLPFYGFLAGACCSRIGREPVRSGVRHLLAGYPLLLGGTLWGRVQTVEER